MKPLYLIDRSLTRLIKFTASSIEGKFHLDLSTQATLLGAVLIVLSIIQGARMGMDTSVTGLVWFIFFFLVDALFIELPLYTFLSKALIKLHHIFDFEEAESRSKLYSNGYPAWSYLLIGLLAIIFSGINPGFVASYGTWTFGFGLLGLYVYEEFANRREGLSEDSDSPKHGIWRRFQR